MQIKEIGIQMYVKESGQEYTANNSHTVYDLFEDLKNANVEHLYAVNLNVKNKILSKLLISKGDVAKTAIFPAEIAKGALLSNAAGVILVHNHPSGDCSPSKDDIATTKRIKDALNLFNIKLIDHIIVASEGHYSMQAENNL